MRCRQPTRRCNQRGDKKWRVNSGQRSEIRSRESPAPGKLHCGERTKKLGMERVGASDIEGKAVRVTVSERVGSE